MLISDKQHAANVANAQKSTGPKTPEGKDAIRNNALTHGLRSRLLIIKGESFDQYFDLWTRLIDEWQPVTATECHLVEQMAHALWLQLRANLRENMLCSANVSLQEEIALADRLNSHRARFDRSFSQAVDQLQKLRERRAVQAKLVVEQPVEKKQPEQSAAGSQAAPPPKQPSIVMPMPSYIMSDSPSAPPSALQCASDTKSVS